MINGSFHDWQGIPACLGVWSWFQKPFFPEFQIFKKAFLRYSPKRILMESSMHSTPPQKPPFDEVVTFTDLTKCPTCKVADHLTYEVSFDKGKVITKCKKCGFEHVAVFDPTR